MSLPGSRSPAVYSYVRRGPQEAGLASGLRAYDKGGGQSPSFSGSPMVMFRFTFGVSGCSYPISFDRA